MSVEIYTTAEGPLMHVEYQKNQYSDAFISNLMQCYANVLRSMLTVERLAEIKLTNQEQLSVLDSFNQTDVPYDNSQTIVSLFRQQAALHSDKMAVVFEDRQFTYRQVDDMSECLASYLVSKGLGREDVVSILIPRSEWMVIASLGVLKAGCAYQPIDPTYPEERQKFMMEDAGSKLLLTIDNLDALTREPRNDDTSKPRNVELKPEDLFTLIYTSGSTGVPKGCQLEHRNMVAFCHMHCHTLHIDSDSRVGAYASYGFDACLQELWATLVAGATIYIIPEELRLDLLRLNEYFEQNGITHTFMTTQVARQFVNDIDNHSLKAFITGGEKLVDVTPPHYLLLNGYGPSESICYVTTFAVKEKIQNIPIGKAVENMHLYVVDMQGKR
jgi:non-ribosomal peptide synthetase component F